MLPCMVLRPGGKNLIGRTVEVMDANRLHVLHCYSLIANVLEENITEALHSAFHCECSDCEHSEHLLCNGARSLCSVSVCHVVLQLTPSATRGPYRYTKEGL